MLVISNIKYSLCCPVSSIYFFHIMFEPEAKSERGRKER